MVRAILFHNNAKNVSNPTISWNTKTYTDGLVAANEHVSADLDEELW